MSHLQLNKLSLVERETIEIAQELVRIESVSNSDRSLVGDGEETAALYIKDLLEEVGLSPEYFQSAPGRGNLVCRISSGNGDPALVVHAHLDVVPAADDDWTVPPFSGVIRDGYLWGRGIVDMKGMAAMMVAVARDYARHEVTPDRDLILAFFADEETGGKYGAGWMVENHPEAFHGASEALSEIGGFSITLASGRRAYLLATAEKGIMWARLSARGLAGHASMPTADNALARLAGAVDRLANHKFPLVRTEAIEMFLAAISKDMEWQDTADDIEDLILSLGTTGRAIKAALRNTVSPSMFHSGDTENVIPSYASAVVDCRVVPGSEEAFKEEFTSIVGEDVDVDWMMALAGIEAPPTGLLVDLLASGIKEQDADGIVVPYLLPAGTDNKHLSQLGIAGYGFTPLRVPAGFDVLKQFHAPDERIPLEALMFGARVLHSVLVRR